MASAVPHRYTNYPDAAPSWTISEANNHCVYAFDKLRIQREQGRFCDVSLSIQGREFPAHRCVLASCSPWFDSNLKMHKTVREHVEITSDQCENYEIFYQLLTYFYTGQINITQTNVAELLHLAHCFSVFKLKVYCAEYLERNLTTYNVISVMDMATKYNLSDLIRQALVCLQRNFHVIYDKPEILSCSLGKVQMFLSMSKNMNIPQELLLQFITKWVSFDASCREESFISLINFIQWDNISTSFVAEHLSKEQLYCHSNETLFSILHILDNRKIYLNKYFQELYQNLQEKLFPDQDLEHELEDNNSFLSMAINSAVKDLEHSDVDPDWFLSDPSTAPTDNAYYRSAGGHETRQDRAERYKTTDYDFSVETEYQIVEQVINEQISEERCNKGDDRQKYRDCATSVKRFDPKFRALTALTEDFRQAEFVEEVAPPPPPPQQQPQPQPQQPVVDPSVKAQLDGQRYYKYPSLTEIKMAGTKDPNGVFEMPDVDRSGIPDVDRSGMLVQPNITITPINKQVIQWTEVNESAEQYDGPAAQFDSPPIIEQYPPLVDPMQGFDNDPMTSNSVSPPKIEEKVAMTLPKQRLKKYSKTHPPQEENKVPKHQHGTLKEKLLAKHKIETSKAKVRVPKLQCPDCDYVTAYSKRMVVHRRQHNDNSSFPCPYFPCQFTSKWKKQTRQHILENHVSGPPFKCDVCDYTQDKLYILLDHRRTHDSCKTYRCDLCPFATKTRKLLRSHRSVHDKKHGCQHEGCGKVFQNRKCLDAHRLTHQEEAKWYYCDQCKTFKTKYKNHYQLHMRIHSGNVESCTFPNCSYRTPKTSLMKAHVRVHLKEKPFPCDECGKNFREKGHLTRHKKLHTDTFYTCDREGCEFKSKRKDKLKSHVLKVHQKTEQTKQKGSVQALKILDYIKAKK